MKMTAADQQALGVVDIVVPEPGEGAHVDHAETARRLKAIVVDRLAALDELPIDELLEARYRRYRALGSYTEAEMPEPTPPAGGPWPGRSSARPARSRAAGSVSGAVPQLAARRAASPRGGLARVRPGPARDARRRGRSRRRRADRRRAGRRPRRHRRLDDELLPALIAKLGATGLGELEVREDALRVRLRRPADGVAPRTTGEPAIAGRDDRSRGARAAAPAPPRSPG